jgi:hypothetical protein
MSIEGSCKASPCGVSARIPEENLSPRLFSAVCGDIVTEIRDFHQELRDRFQYDLGGDWRQGPPSSGSSLPLRKQSGEMTLYRG